MDLRWGEGVYNKGYARVFTMTVNYPLMKQFAHGDKLHANI